MAGVRVRGVRWAGPDGERFSGLDADFGPGLHWVIGDEGRGKSLLLALLAGRVEPSAGLIERRGDGVFLEHLSAPELDDQVAARWLEAVRARYPAWQSGLEPALVEAFGLAPHLAKPFFQLSAGSRRKVGLLAAAASGAALTLLDGPFAALDVPSQRALVQVLQTAARDRTRCWVVADYAPHPACAGDSVLDPDAV